jgi:hypothetical protein
MVNVRQTAYKKRYYSATPSFSISMVPIPWFGTVVTGQKAGLVPLVWMVGWYGCADSERCSTLIEIVDTGGAMCYQSLQPRWIKDSDMILVVFNNSLPSSLHEAEEILMNVLRIGCVSVASHRLLLPAAACFVCYSVHCCLEEPR